MHGHFAEVLAPARRVQSLAAMKKTTKKLALRSDTIRQLGHGQLARVGGGEDTHECVFDQDPGPGGGGGSVFPQYCSLIVTVCGCG